MTHAHITSWLVALILFFVAVSLHKAGKEKGSKIVHMTLRLFYLIIIATGVVLLLGVEQLSGLYHVKATVGILAIGLMEMVLVRTKKGKSTNVSWILFAIIFVVTVYLGLKLPIGLYLF
ncbi:YisL family protein [Bacillus timonensis]|nr:YisL family protein [Bacillus timonensis]